MAPGSRLHKIVQHGPCWKMGLLTGAYLQTVEVENASGRGSSVLAYWFTALPWEGLVELSCWFDGLTQGCPLPPRAVQ